MSAGITKVFASVLLVLTVFACGDTHPQSAVRPAAAPLVTEVVDGDTIVIQFPTGVTEQVRLLGIDTPETVDPSRPKQCFGAEASEHVRRLLPAGTAVRLERDVEARDHFDRLLAYVFREHDDLFVNLELVRHGFADVTFYDPNNAHRAQFDRALIAAQTRQAGLWAACGGADVAIDPEP